MLNHYIQPPWSLLRSPVDPIHVPPVAVLRTPKSCSWQREDVARRGGLAAVDAPCHESVATDAKF